MKTRLAQKCRDIRQELKDGSLIQEDRIDLLEEELLHSLDRMKEDPSEVRIAVMKGAIRTLGRQARLLRSQVEENPESLQKFPSRGIQPVKASEDYDQAMIQIEREMHETKGSVKDILKSLLMWKDAPEEKLGKSPRF